ncbi:hypothetical protein J6T21_04350 [Candidatus Saccharibacteria bacterium]|nr:hypothetical protein [Candidatus Saccharibacteria bacterium]
MRGAEYGYIVSDPDIIMRQLKYFARDVVYFADDHPIVAKKQLGSYAKGLRNEADCKIYIRNRLPQPLKDITFLHELHHAAQTPFSNPGYCGLWTGQEQFGRLIMEGQTQYCAEEILYNPFHNTSSTMRFVPGLKMRMKDGQSVCSGLHNYEYYDAILSKFALILGVPKEFFVYINYNPQGINLLKDKYEEAKKRLGLSLSFGDVMYCLDYFYTVDIVQYCDTEWRDVLVSGNETKDVVPIHPNRCESLSLAKQHDKFAKMDETFFSCLLSTDKPSAVKFKDFIFDDCIRANAKTLLSSN